MGYAISTGPVVTFRATEYLRNERGADTAFMNFTGFKKYATDIVWESEVWIADFPDHMIHFNGDKFLGPYPR